MKQQKNPDIIITNAYKHEAVAIMSLDNYINEADHQLSDKDNDKQLPNNPTLQYNEMLSNTIERFQTKNLLLKKMQKA